MILSVIIYIRNWKSRWQLCQRLFCKYKHKDWLSEVVVHYFVAVDIQWVALVGGRNCTQKAFRSYTCRPFCWRQRNGLQACEPLLTRLGIEPDDYCNHYSEERCECHYCVDHILTPSVVQYFLITQCIHNSTLKIQYFVVIIYSYRCRWASRFSLPGRSLLLHHPLVHLDEAFLLCEQSFERLDALSQHSIRLHGHVAMHGRRAEVAVRLNLSVSGWGSFAS